MSIKVMSRVWEYSQHSGSELLLLLAIADFADDDGNAFPGRPLLAKKTRMHERSVSRLRQKLYESGELIKISGGNGKGDRLSVRVMVRVTPLSSKGDTPVMVRVTDDALKGDTPVTRTIIESPIESPIESSSSDDDEKITAAIVDTLEKVGVGLNAYTVDKYMDLVQEFGSESTIRGILVAAENGKQNAFAYVTACTKNLANGTQPQYKNRKGNRNGTGQQNNPANNEYTAEELAQIERGEIIDYNSLVNR